MAKDILVSLHGRRIGLDVDGNLIIDGVQCCPAPNPTGAEDYFVDGNVGTSGAGKSWEGAFDTVAEAIAASNISIALTANRWWARRNRIFIQGDGEFNEDLTVMPEKTDMIGQGYDILPFPRIVGNHAVAAATVGTRLINLGFYTDATGDLMSWPAGSHGLQILGCWMHPGTTSTKAIEITDSAHVRIVGNEITVGTGSMSIIFAEGISIEGTVCHDTFIDDNNITATKGVSVVEAAAAAMGSRMKGNLIRATGYCIDDNSDDFQVVRNDMISDAAATAAGVGVIDCNSALAVANRITCNDHANAPFPVEGTLAG